jgi:hypothetical protein
VLEIYLIPNTVSPNTFTKQSKHINHKDLNQSKSTMKLNMVLLSAAALVNATTGTYDTPVFLGAAGGYVILAKTGISTVPTSDITSDIAVSPIAATALLALA